MSIDFDKLYSLVENINKSSNEKCMICHFPVDSDELILSCKHYYHSSCLNKKTSKIICPYCEKSVTVQTKPKIIIPSGCKVLLKSGVKKGEYCGRENCSYHKFSDNIKIISKNVCQSILKSGFKKGQACGRNNCKIHLI